MPTQILVIGGGDTFASDEEYLKHLKGLTLSLDRFHRVDWKKELQKNLGKDYNVLLLEMPNKHNARYFDWKIMFEKMIPLLNDDVILIGHSLGGIFLAKYLSENNFPKTITATFLVAAPYDAEGTDYDLCDFNLTQGLTKFEEQSPNIYLFYSTDDRVVPYSNFEKYRQSFRKPFIHVFHDAGHFTNGDLPELVESIQNIRFG